MRRKELERDTDFGSVVARHQAHLEKVALRLCRNRAEAADLVQVALERALVAYKGFEADDDGTAFARERGWLVRILKNAWIDDTRARTRNPTVPLDSVPPPVSPPPDVPAEWEGVTLAAVHEAVDTLPSKFKDPFVLFHFEGLDYRVISKRLRIKLGTVATRLYRARARVRKELEQS